MALRPAAALVAALLLSPSVRAAAPASPEERQKLEEEGRKALEDGKKIVTQALDAAFVGVEGAKEALEEARRRNIKASESGALSSGATMKSYESGGAFSRAELAEGASSRRLPPPSPGAAQASVVSIPAVPGVRPTAQSALAGGAQELGTLITRGSEELARDAGAKLQAGDLEGAVADATRGLELDPGSVQARLRRAEGYNRLQRYELAAIDAEQAVRQDPSSARAWQNSAWAKAKLDRPREALRDADEAVRLDQKDALNYAIRAYIREQSGDHEGALADLERAAALDPRYRAALEAARKGAKIFDPYDESTLAGELSVAGGPAGSGGVRLSVLIVGVLSALALAAAAWLMGRARRKGAFFDKYRIEREMGRGGMGEVYEAFDTTLSRRVAVKKLADEFAKENPAAREIFLREARSVAALDHPSIVQIHEVAEDGPDVYLVFELLKGSTAAELLSRQVKLTPEQALFILAQTCEALDYAHGRGVVHRDLKPGNVMVTENGRVKLMDFGIAKQLGDGAEVAKAAREKAVAKATTSSVAGTTSYMAPEASLGVVCPQGDVFSLGVMAYEMLTGRIPERDGIGAVKMEALELSGLSPRVLAVLKRALAARPEERQATAGSFAAQLRGAAAGL